MAVTLDYDDRLSRVRISVDALPASASARVERSTDQIRWTTVRGGAAVAATSGVASLDDYEFVPGAPNFYRVTPTVVEDFEDSTLAVTVSGTWLRSNTSAHAGQWAYRSAAIGHDASSDAVVSVPAGALTCELAYRVSSESGWDFLRILRDGVEVLAESGESGWRRTSFDVAGAAAVTLRYVKDVGVVAGADAAWVDDLTFTLAVQSAQITPVDHRLWVKSIARPFLNRPLPVVTDVSPISRPARSGLFSPLGRSLPIAINSARGSRRWTLTVLTQSPSEAETLDLILASGDPLYLQVPPGSNVPGGYVTVGDSDEGRYAGQGGQPDEPRSFVLPLTEVAPPAAHVVGATVTCQTVLVTYPTCADVLEEHPTCADLLELIGDPSDVIVS